jgi:hypothetical protein
LTSPKSGFKVKKPMKINQLMQVIFISGSVCVAAPAFAGTLVTGQVPAPSCGDEKEDEDEDDDKDGETRLCGDDADEDEDDKDGETRLCGDDEDEDEDDKDGTETLRL